jgi:hypothetical protein
MREVLGSIPPPKRKRQKKNKKKDKAFLLVEIRIAIQRDS